MVSIAHPRWVRKERRMDEFGRARALVLDTAVEAVEVAYSELRRPLRFLKSIRPYCSTHLSEDMWHESVWEVCFWHLPFTVGEEGRDFFFVRVKLSCTEHRGGSHNWHGERHAKIWTGGWEINLTSKDSDADLESVSE